MRRVHASAAAPANQSTMSLNWVKHESWASLLLGPEWAGATQWTSCLQSCPELLSSHFKAGDERYFKFSSANGKKNMYIFYGLHWSNLLSFLFLFYLHYWLKNIFKDRLGISECHQSFHSDSLGLTNCCCNERLTLYWLWENLWPLAGCHMTETLAQVAVSVNHLKNVSFLTSAGFWWQHNKNKKAPK